LVGKREWKRTLEDQRVNGNNIRIYLREIVRESVAQDMYQWYALVNTAMNRLVP
jgi:hypothetical protein